MKRSRSIAPLLAVMALLVFGLVCALPSLVRVSDGTAIALTEEETKEPIKDELGSELKGEHPAYATFLQKERLLLALVNHCDDALPTAHVTEVPVPPPELSLV